MIAAILSELDNPSDVAYYLARNRAEGLAISRLQPVAAVKAIARIESEIAKTLSTPGKGSSNAPPPIKPLGSGESFQEKNPEKMTQREYERWRKEQGVKYF